MVRTATNKKLWQWEALDKNIPNEFKTSKCYILSNLLAQPYKSDWKDGRYLYFSNRKVNWHYFKIASQAAWNRISPSCIPLAMLVGWFGPPKLISLGAIASWQEAFEPEAVFLPQKMLHRNYAPIVFLRMTPRWREDSSSAWYRRHLSICHSQEVVLPTAESGRYQGEVDWR